ncbi:MAG: ribonuclease HII [Bacilli bacterium]|mgnify:CR=1 FL=1|nr:ribonuclease HII [Bacilli bacterium]
MINDIYKYEEELYQKGYKFIAGCDEAGRGPMAGPLVAASVILPIGYKLDGLNDSKKLTAKKRDLLFDIILRDAVQVEYEIISVNDVDRLNPLEASRLAMTRSVQRMKNVDYVLTDCMDLDVNLPVLSLIKGDAKSASIAAASIIAKVTRDRIMEQLDKEYPMYEFKKHKGYVTKRHLELLSLHGVSEVHRKSYAPVKKVLNNEV